MRRFAIVTVVVLAAILVIGQFALPAYIDHRIEQRLTANGGHADASVSAFPALRLLRREGSSVKIAGEGITIPQVGPTNDPVLKNLDGFGRVDIRLTSSRAGPLRVSVFSLERRNDGPYAARIAATVTARDLSAFGGGVAAGPLGELLGGIAGSSVPLGDQPIPIDLSATVTSQDGHPQASNVQGAIAGLPAGPLIEALAAAVGGRVY
jgi:hypothetical protein